MTREESLGICPPRECVCQVGRSEEVRVGGGRGRLEGRLFRGLDHTLSLQEGGGERGLTATELGARVRCTCGSDHNLT